MISSSYNDTSADLQLVSKDGTIFYVESFYLMSGSKVFRDMLKDPALHPSPDQPIHIDTSADILELFLDILVTEKKIFQGKFDVSTALELIRLFDLYESDRGRARAAAALTLRPDLPFWTLFRFASLLDNIDVAVIAISHKQYPAFESSDAKVIDNVWIRALAATYTTLWVHHSSYTGRGGGEKEVDMSSAAWLFAKYLQETRSGL